MRQLMLGVAIGFVLGAVGTGTATDDLLDDMLDESGMSSAMEPSSAMTPSWSRPRMTGEEWLEYRRNLTTQGLLNNFLREQSMRPFRNPC